MKPSLKENQIDQKALQAMQNFHSDVISKIETAVSQNKIVVIGMAQNPYVKKAKAALDAKELKYQYLEYGNYFSQWKERLAIKLWSGWPTFPQVFMDGKLIGGFDQLTARLANSQ